MSITPYLRIARFDHWFKNAFMLPGVILALYDYPDLWSGFLLIKVVLALIAAGCVASSNYILNEVLDAPRDALHPVKRHRPVPSGQIRLKWAYFGWAVFALAGLGLAWTLGLKFFLAGLALWIMGCVYNIPPIRTKDKPYLDVLSESVNNPLRLLMGWYAVRVDVLPPVSLLAAYWMVGAFFMAVKRFGEYRRIGNPDIAARYRASFGYYDEEKLLVSITYYAVAFGLFFGIFLLRYRVELLLSIPFIAGFVGWYIHLGFLKDSPAQYPEKLYKQAGFMLYSLFCVTILIALLFIDVPIIGEWFQPTIRTQ
ncbi:MAG: UbiA prenyltransferase family protein [Gammaproteobacteria bacterium]|nr:UbiA prenyltransferase family protein [Gammaproteobacteria bacterium]